MERGGYGGYGYGRAKCKAKAKPLSAQAKAGGGRGVPAFGPLGEDCNLKVKSGGSRGVGRGRRLCHTPARGDGGARGGY